MKTSTIIIGCYYPSSLDNYAKTNYIIKNTPISNLLYERILVEDFFKKNDENNNIIALSAPSFGYYKKQCKKKKINFENNDKVHYISYSTRRLFLHISKSKELARELKKIMQKCEEINLIICEAHLPYLLAVKQVKKKYRKKLKKITLIIPDMPENVKRQHYGFFESILKKVYINYSKKLMNTIPDQYICFTEEILKTVNKNKDALISCGIIENDFKNLIQCEDKITFAYSGKLEECNGIAILIDAFNLICKTKKNMSLVICGDGPLKNYVISEARKNTSIQYKGFLTEKENSEVLRSSKVLICPRLPSEKEKFCFPSKLVNYSKYNSQIVVFRNEIYEKNLKDSVVYSENITISSLANAMLDALTRPINVEQRLEFIERCKSERVINFCLNSSIKNRN